MKKKNYILGTVGLSVCLLCTLASFVNATWTTFPASYTLVSGYHTGGVINDVNMKDEGKTLDFKQNGNNLKIRFYWPGKSRGVCLYFKFTDTCTDSWLAVLVYIYYVEWWVPSQGYKMGEGDKTLALWSWWKVNYVEIYYVGWVWYQEMQIDYLAIDFY